MRAACRRGRGVGGRKGGHGSRRGWSGSIMALPTLGGEGPSPLCGRGGGYLRHREHRRRGEHREGLLGFLRGLCVSAGSALKALLQGFSCALRVDAWHAKRPGRGALSAIMRASPSAKSPMARKLSRARCRFAVSLSFRIATPSSAFLPHTLATMADIPDILFLRGASAFSAFRFQGLQQRIRRRRTGLARRRRVLACGQTQGRA